MPTTPMMRREQGIALPVMLIMLTVMLISTVYLLKSSTSSSMTSANLAYDSALSRAVDLGILNGFDWLQTTAASKASKQSLESNSAANGYVATLDTSQSVNSAGFWQGSVSVTDNVGNRIEYVIHRMCALVGPYDQIGPPSNKCMQTATNTSAYGNSVALGESLASDSTAITGLPQLHYVVTARIFGVRGGNVVNQAVVMIGV